MAKLLRIKDYIVLGLAMAGEFSEDFRLVNGLLPKMMEIKYGYVPPNFKRQSYISSVSRLLKTGEISKTLDKNGQVFLELTSVGVGRLKRKFPIFTKNKWDGSFMIVVFDIPKKDHKAREVLRNKLIELGFGMLQESVWISPYHFEEDLKEFLDIKGYTNYTFVLKAKKLVGENIRDLVAKIWKLEPIEAGYEDILNGNFDAKTTWDEYFSILSRDPLLPENLLPVGWPRAKVVKYLNSLALKKNIRPYKKLQSK